MNSSSQPSSSHADDRRLAQAAASGDRASAEAFAVRMHVVPALLHKLNGSLGRPLNSSDLADLTQDTLTRLWEKLPGFAGLSSLETWAYHFCCLELMNATRRKRKSNRMVTLDPQSKEQLTTAVEPAVLHFEDLHKQLEGLEPKIAAVIRLKCFEDLTFEEIGQRLSLPVNTAKTHYYRGLKRLKDQMHRNGDGE